MKYKKLMLVTFVLLAILTLGAVNAADVSDSDGLAVDDVGGSDSVASPVDDADLLSDDDDGGDEEINGSDSNNDVIDPDDEGDNGEEDSFEVWVDNDEQGFDVSSPDLSGYNIAAVTVPENTNGNISIITEDDDVLFNKALNDFDSNHIRDNNIYDITLSDNGKYIFEGVEDGTLFRFAFLDDESNELWRSPDYKLVIEDNTIWLELNDDKPEVELDNLIMDAADGSTLFLDKDYIFSGPFKDDTSIGISIDKEIIIDGQGHTIDANNYCTIFAIDRPGITLKNIIFRNGHVSDDWSGGAIGGGNPDLCVVNCTFENNIATDTDNAGAIAMIGDNIAIINSTFINNEGYNMGSIRIQGSGAIISNCVFMNNRANTEDDSKTKGGAISIEGESATITDCVFVNNAADLGSDIYIQGSSENFIIESCNSDAGDSSIYFAESNEGGDDEFDPTKFSIDRRDDENNILALQVPVFSLYCPDGSEGTVNVTVSYNGNDYSVSKNISDMDENNYLHWYLNDLNMNLLVKYEIHVNVNDGEFESDFYAYVHGPISSFTYDDKLYINTFFDYLFEYFEVPSEYDDARVIVEFDGMILFNKTLKEFEHADVANESYYWYHPSYGPGPGDERFKHYVVYNGAFGDIEAKTYNVTASIIFENSPIIGNHTFISTGTIDVVEGIVENKGVKMEAAHDRNYNLDDDDEVSILLITAPEGANGKVTVSLNDKIIFESNLDELDSEDGHYLLRLSKLELDEGEYELTFAYFEDDEKIVETSEVFTFFHGGDDEDPYQIEVEENFDIADPDTEIIKIHCPDGRDGYFVVIADNDEIKLRYDYTIREIDWDDDIHITASDLKLLDPGVYNIFVYHTDDLDDLEDCQIYEKWGAIEAIDYTQFRVIELDTFEPNALFINPIFAVYCPEGNEGNITVTVRQGDEEEPFIRSEKSISDKDDENKLYWTLSELNMDNKGEYFINVFYGDDDLQRGMRVEVVGPIYFEEVSLINSTDHGRLVYVEIPSDIVDANITLIINGEEIFTKALDEFVEGSDEAPYWDYMRGSGWTNTDYKRYFIENYHIGYDFSEDAYQMTINLAIAGRDMITESAEVRVYNRNVVSNDRLSIEIFANQRYYLDNDWSEVVLINTYDYCGGNIVITVADNDWTFEYPLGELDSKNDEGDFQIYPCAFNGLGPGDYEITVAYFEGEEKIIETSSAFVTFYGDDDEGDDSDDGVVIWVREGDDKAFDLSDEDDLSSDFAYVSVSNDLDGTIVFYCFNEEEDEEQDFFHIDLSEVNVKYDDEERDGFTVYNLSFNSLGDKLDDFKELGWFKIAFVTGYGDDESREVDSRAYNIDYDDETNVIKFGQDDGEDDPILDEIEFNFIKDEDDLIFEMGNNVHVANLLIPDLEEFEGTVVNIIIRKNGTVVQEINTSDIEREDLQAAHRYPICIDLTKFDDMDDLDIEVDCFDYDGRLWEFTVEIDGDTVILHEAPEDEYYVFYGNITTRELNNPSLMGPHPNERFVSVNIHDSSITEGSIVVSYGDSVIEYSFDNCTYDKYRNFYWISLDKFDLMTLPENEFITFTFNVGDKSYTFKRIRQGDYLYKVITPDDFDWQGWSNFKFVISDVAYGEEGSVGRIIGNSNMQSIYIDFSGGYFDIYVDDVKIEGLGYVVTLEYLRNSIDDDGLDLTFSMLNISKSGTYNIRIVHVPEYDDEGEYFYYSETEVMNKDVVVDFSLPDGNVTKDTFSRYFDDEGVLISDLSELKFIGDFTGLEVANIIINKPVTITGVDATFTDVSFNIVSDDVAISGISLKYTTPEDTDAYAIVAYNVANFLMENNTVVYTGLTDGTYINNALRINGGSNIKIRNNAFVITIPSAGVNWVEEDGVWNSYPVSEGIVFNDCEDVEFDANIVDVRFNKVVGSNDTIYSIDVKNSNGVAITNNDIRATGKTYIYGIIISAEDFEISDNAINVTSEYYVNAIDIEGPASGVVDNNTIDAAAPNSVYGIYATSFAGPSTVDFTYNTITGEGYYVVGIFDDSELIKGNVIELTGNYTIGIAVLSEASVEDNTIILDASNIGNEALYDAVNPETVGIYVTNDAFITNNKVVSTAKSIIVLNGTSTFSNNDLTGFVSINSDYNVFENNTVVTDNDYAVEVNATENVIVDNFLSAKDLTGDGAVYAIEGNTIKDNRGPGEEIESTIELSNDIEFTYNETGSAKVTLVGASDIIVSVVDHDEANVIVSDGLITVSGLDAGEYILNITTVPEKGFTATTKLVNITVNKIDVNLTVEVDDVNVGEVSRIRVFGYDIVKVRVGVNTYSVNCTGGVGYLELVLNAGTHNVNAKFEGDKNINPAEVNVTFTVSKLNPTIAINTGEAIEGSDLEVSVDIADATGVVSINGVNVTLTDGKATTTIKNIAAGDLTVDVVYFGDNKYLNASNSTTVVVKAKENAGLNITVNDIKVGETAVVNVEINSEVTGKVTIDGNEVTIADGKGTFTIDNLAAGEHTVTAVFAGDKYFKADEKTAAFTVTKLDSPISIDIPESQYTAFDNFQITIGNVTAVNVTINNKAYAVKADGTVDIDTTALDADTYTVVVLNEENDVYKANSTSKSFTIIKKASEVSIDVGANYNVGDDFAIEIDNNTIVTVTINDVAYEIKDGKVVVDTTKLVAGEYTVVATIAGDDKYLPSNDTASFKINKLTPSIVIAAGEAIEGSDVTVEVSVAGATGIVNINGENVTLADAKATTTFTDLLAGNMVVNVIYYGDANYLNATNSLTVPVKAKQNAGLVVSAGDINVGETATVVIVINANVTGKVTIDGNEVDIADGKGIYNISGLTAGEHTVTAIFAGDKYFKAETANATFKVNKLPSQVSVKVNKQQYSVGDAFDITVVNNTAAVVTINNNPYEVKDGKVIIDTSKLAAGEYAVAATIAENDKYLANSSTVTFKVAKVETPANSTTIPVDGSAKESKTPTYTINLPSDATGTLIVTINGKNYTGDVVNGKANVKVDDLKPGSYKATITYSGDAKYSPIVKNTTSTVVVDPKVVAKQTSVLYTGKYSVTVYGKDGKVAKSQAVKFYINGKYVKTVKTTSKGVATFNIPSKYPPTKKYTVKAVALGKTASKKVTVKQILTLKTVKVKKSGKLVLTATVKKVNGKYPKGKITFKFRGNKVKIVSLKNGVAKVTVPTSKYSGLSVGTTVKYSATYLKTTVQKKTKVKA